MRHTKCGAHYVDRHLKDELARMLWDSPLRNKTDRRAALWIRNFRQHIAEHFDGLEDHVLTKKSGVSKDRLPVYLPLAA